MKKKNQYRQQDGMEAFRVANSNTKKKKKIKINKIK